MTPAPMRLEIVTLGDLPEVIAATEAGSFGAVPPLSVQRARAWMMNPHARPDDPALIVALRGQDCLGYLGMFPALCRVGGQTESVTWLSTWFVPEDHRPQGVGSLLLLKLREIPGNIVVTGVSAIAGELYRAAGFREFGPLRYLTVELSPADGLSLPARALRSGVRKTLGSGAGESVSALVRALRNHEARRACRALANSSSGLQRGDISHVQPSMRDDAFLRDQATIRWMIESPWVTGVESASTPGFRFRDYDPTLRFQVHEGPGSDARPAHMVTRRSTLHSNRVLAVLDRSANVEATSILATAIDEALADPVDRLILPLECEAALSDTSGVKMVRQSRPYFGRFEAGSRLAEAADELHLELTDGDWPYA